MGAKRSLAKVFGLYFFFRKNTTTKNIDRSVLWHLKKSTEDYSLSVLNSYKFY